MSDLTEAEIRSFQQARGLDVTGFVDAVTERALEEARAGNLEIDPCIFKILN